MGGQLNIEDAKTVRRARQFADATGQPITQAIRSARERGLKRHPENTRLIEALRRSIGLEIVDMTLERARPGRNGYRTYGGGTGHPARLIFGVRFASALARASDEPRLFKGDDFVPTDITPAA